MTTALTLEDMEARIRGMSPEARKKLEQAALKHFKKVWLSQPGPQTDALNSVADELLYGGSVGGGKSDLLLGLATTQHLRSIIFRRQASDLDKLWTRLKDQILAGHVVKSDATHHRLRTDDQRFIEFGHLEKPGSEKSHQGNDHDLYGFDEAAQLDEFKVAFVIQWLRSTTPGQRKRVVFATNPPIPEYRDGKIVDTGTGAWLKEWFAPWLEDGFANPAKPGELRWCFMRTEGDRLVTVWVAGPGAYDPITAEQVLVYTQEDVDKGIVSIAKSRTFIRAMLNDNVYLKNTGYAAQLSSTPEPLKSLLLTGSFTVKGEDHPMQVIPTLWVLEAQARWKARDPLQVRNLRQLVLAGDIAQGGADTTVLAPLYHTDYFGELLTQPGSKTPTGIEVQQLVLTTRKNQSLIVLDGSGGWGGSTRDLLLTHHKIVAEMCNAGAGSTEWTADLLWKFKNIRAQMWWQFREALDPKSTFQIALPPSTRLMTQLTAPIFFVPAGVMLIESKDDVRVRIGSSTDEADAIIMAWLYRDQAIAQMYRSQPDIVQRLVHGTTPEQLDEQMRSSVPLDDPLAGQRR